MCSRRESTQLTDISSKADVRTPANCIFDKFVKDEALLQNLCWPKPQRFNVELSDLDRAEEDPVEALGHLLKAQTIGKGLKVPVVSIPVEKAGEHFGPFFGTL
jgi:hypothetical protein